MNEFLARLETESPKFFKRIAKFGKYLIAVGLGLIAITKAPITDIRADVLDVVNTVGDYCAFAGSLIVVLCNLTVADQSELQSKIENKS